MLAPAAGGTHHIPFGQIFSITEPEPFAVRITLADGTAIDLSRLGVMRTQLLAELRDSRADDITAGSERISLSFADAARVRDYTVTVEVVGRAPLAGIHPELAGTLLAIATLPARQAAVAELARRTDLAIGFKQLASVACPRPA